MNEKQIAILKQNLTLKDGQPVTTSRQVAASFDKEHRNVLQAIDNLECSRDFHRLNFQQMAHYRANPVTGGQTESRAYTMTKNGFLFLAMGFSGKKAAALREGYIAAFDLMEAELRSGLALTREQALLSTLAMVAEAAKCGHDPLFLPELVHARFAGFSCEKAGRLLGVGRSTVANWTRKLVDAGFDIPSGTTVDATIVSLRRMAGAGQAKQGASAQQLPLFPTEGRA